MQENRLLQGRIKNYKRCYKCEAYKHFNSFGRCKVGKFKRQSHCKKCADKMKKKHKKDNIERYRELDRIRYNRDKSKRLKYSNKYNKLNKKTKEELRNIYAKRGKQTTRNWNLKRKYKINVNEYNKMLEQQNFSCLICKKHESEFKKVLSIDHDHKTGKIRGLLCQFCNTGLGFFRDNINLLESAIGYLKINE
jgi:RecJ-like exonuclease